MNAKIILLTSLIFFLSGLSASAGSPFTFPDIDIDEVELPNPFDSKLPVPEKKVRQTPKSKDRRPATARKPRLTTAKKSKKSDEDENKPPQFNVNGIIWNSDRPQAIINGQVVDIGDTILESRIIAIDKNKIVVERNDQTFILTP